MTQKLTLAPVFIALLTTCCLFSCQEKALDSLENFYFPFDGLSTGLLYVYETNPALGLSDEIWFYESRKQNGSQELQIGIYDSNLALRQLITERQTNQGMVVDNVTLYTPDSLSNLLAIEVDLKKTPAFPFYVPLTTEVIAQEMVWVDPLDSLQYTYIKERTYNGINESLDTVTFDTRTELETFWVHDGATTSEWHGHEKYKLGVGLVEYSKVFNAETQMVYRLKGRYTMNDYLSKMK